MSAKLSRSRWRNRNRDGKCQTGTERCSWHGEHSKVIILICHHIRHHFHPQYVGIKRKFKALVTSILINLPFLWFWNLTTELLTFETFLIKAEEWHHRIFNHVSIWYDDAGYLWHGQEWTLTVPQSAEFVIQPGRWVRRGGETYSDRLSVAIGLMAGWTRTRRQCRQHLRRVIWLPEVDEWQSDGSGDFYHNECDFFGGLGNLENNGDRYFYCAVNRRPSQINRGCSACLFEIIMSLSPVVY